MTSDRIYSVLRAEGIGAKRAERIARRIASELATGGHPEAAGSTRIERTSLGPSDILNAMNRVCAAAWQGALVSLRDVRRELGNPVDYDRVVLALADAGRVALHRHDYPAGLSAAEKAEIIPDGRGSYYIGIALRD